MSQLLSLGIEQIVLDGQAISYAIKRSLRARHVRLEVRLESGLTVVIPRRFNPEDIQCLLYKKKHWIQRKLMDCREYQYKHIDTSTVEYLGRTFQVIELRDHNNRYGVSLEQNRIIVNLGKNGDLKQLLEVWFRREAEKLLGIKLAAFSQIIGVHYNKFVIRNTRTRWGSCSRLASLSFNWKLIKVPEPVIDYVIIHELCHLKEMNHSRAFWKLVEKYCPDCYEHRSWLKKHEAGIAGN